MPQRTTQEKKQEAEGEIMSWCAERPIKTLINRNANVANKKKQISRPISDFSITSLVPPYQVGTQ